jgi:hypothetical protein
VLVVFITAYWCVATTLRATVRGCRMVEQLNQAKLWVKKKVHLLHLFRKELETVAAEILAETVAETKIKEGQRVFFFYFDSDFFLVVYITRFDPHFLFKLLQNNHSEHHWIDAINSRKFSYVA